MAPRKTLAKAPGLDAHSAITDVCAQGDGGPCDLVEVGEFPDQSGLVGRITLERCRNCGLGVTRPPLADVAFLYADRTSVDFQPKTSGLSRLIKRIAFSFQARSMLRQAGFAGGRIVDFACGSGLFTDCMAQVSGADVIGADFHDQPPADLGDTPYRPITSLDDLEGTADLVLAMHVLEHDDDPRALLARVARLARPGGTIIIEVPNIDCVWAGLFGRNWAPWYIPYHRVHFSRASLNKAVERAGLGVIQAVDVSTPAMGRSIAHVIGRENSTLFILMSAALQPLQWGLEALTRRPSALRLILRKPA